MCVLYQVIAYYIVVEVGVPCSRDQHCCLAFDSSQPCIALHPRGGHEVGQSRTITQTNYSNARESNKKEVDDSIKNETAAYNGVYYCQITLLGSNSALIEDAIPIPDE